jgi:hypothetical protein
MHFAPHEAALDSRHVRSFPVGSSVVGLFLRAFARVLVLLRMLFFQSSQDIQKASTKTHYRLRNKTVFLLSGYQAVFRGRTTKSDNLFFTRSTLTRTY